MATNNAHPACDQCNDDGFLIDPATGQARVCKACTATWTPETRTERLNDETADAIGPAHVLRVTVAGFKAGHVVHLDDTPHPYAAIVPDLVRVWPKGAVAEARIGVRRGDLVEVAR